ncbi:MAG: PQQ-binding-like beta-propeller repeat protein [Acidobacteriota bacterium]
MGKVTRGIGRGWILAAVIAAMLTLGLEPLWAAEASWPGWRGPRHDGTTVAEGLPVELGEQVVDWKLEVPARSGATPAVAEGWVFLAVSYNPEKNDQLEIWGIDAESGKVGWKHNLGGGNKFRYKHHSSSPSPVTDGESVWIVTGTGVLSAFSLEGQLRWQRDLQKDYGAFGMKFGYASSPLLEDGDLFLQVLHSTDGAVPSYALRIDGATGETKWRVDRATEAVAESPDAYSTPMPLRRGEGLEVVISGGDVITGHDAVSGAELWRVGSLNPSNSPRGRIVASPLIAGDKLFAFGKRGPVLAFRLGEEAGSPPQPLWQAAKGTDVPTPVTDGEYLYLINDKGIATTFNAETGEVLYGPERLAVGTYSGSPLLASASGLIYAVSEEGTVTVYATGPKFRIVATSDVGGYTLSSLAVAEDRLLVRTEDHLWAFRTPKAEPAAKPATAAEGKKSEAGR